MLSQTNGKPISTQAPPTSPDCQPPTDLHISNRYAGQPLCHSCDRHPALDDDRNSTHRCARNRSVGTPMTRTLIFLQPDAFQVGPHQYGHFSHHSCLWPLRNTISRSTAPCACRPATLMVEYLSAKDDNYESQGQ